MLRHADLTAQICAAWRPVDRSQPEADMIFAPAASEPLDKRAISGPSLHVRTQPCQIMEADIPPKTRRETPDDLQEEREAVFRCAKLEWLERTGSRLYMVELTV